MGKKKNIFEGLTRDTVLLTFTSLFADVSTEMLYPVLPIFLTQVISAPASIIGIIEGIAVATQNIIQGFSGWISDRFKAPKKVAILGYGLAALSKPLIGLSTSWPQVSFWRSSDRLGTGIRSAPRDALIASSTDEKNRGKAFGLEGVGDNLGAFLGPLIAVFLLFVLHFNIRSIFYLAFIPAFLAFLSVFLVSAKPPAKITTGKVSFSFKSMTKQYWIYILISAIFGLGNLSSAFVILKAKDIGISTETTVLIYAFFNLAAALSSFPIGILSDKLGRKSMLAATFFIFIISFFGFAVTRNFLIMAILFLLYGVFQGMFRAVGKATAVDFTPIEFRASGVGLYSTTIGLTGFFASTIGGQLWVKSSPTATFYYGLFFAVLALVTLLVIFPSKTPRN